MKKLLLTLVVFCCYGESLWGQALALDSTRFITGYECCVLSQKCIATSDHGMLLVGQDGANPGGIIPPFLLDTTFYNVLVAKIDSNRQISWIKVYGGTRDDIAVSACETPDGGFAVLGSTKSDDGNISHGIGDSVNPGNTNFWLLRLDANGNLLWEKTYGSTESDIGLSVACTRDHGFILLGNTNGSDVDVPYHYGGFFDMDWLVIRTDSMGSKLWSRDLGTTIDDDSHGAILSVDSSYYLISSSQSVNHDCTDTSWHPGVFTGYDIYVLKLDEAGNATWGKSYGGSGVDYANDAMLDSRDSTIMIIGFTSSNDYMVTGAQGGGDMWVLKIDRSGTLLWQKTLGGPNGEAGTGICPKVDGGYVVYGSTSPYNVNGGCWLFMLDDSGNETWNKVFGGTAGDFPGSVIHIPDGYAATGQSRSDGFSEGSNVGRCSGGDDIFVSYFEYWPTGVQMIADNPFLGVYPNPVQENVTIKSEKPLAGKLRVVNLLGQCIIDREVERQDGIMVVETGTWPPGMYELVWMGDDGAAMTRKLIKR